MALLCGLLKMESKPLFLSAAQRGGSSDKKKLVDVARLALIRLEALRNLLIDEKVSKVPVGLWHKAHADKSPDLDPSKRKDARQQLQDKGLVVVSDSMVWINREVEADMEPYSDAED